MEVLLNGGYGWEDNLGYLFQPKKDCKLCSGKGVAVFIPPEYYSGDWTNIQPSQICRCVKRWSTATEYDKFQGL